MYVMSYFRTKSEALHLAVSADGLEWRALNDNQPVLEGALGQKMLRDPFIFRDREGRFHLLATPGWYENWIVHAVSDDLLHWGEQEALPVMAGVPGTRNCWAPEAYEDHEAGVYRILWSSTVPAGSPHAPPRMPQRLRKLNHRIWAVTTEDFRTYSPPAIFFDPGYNVIDATVAYHDGIYLMAFKDERGRNAKPTRFKAIRVAQSRNGSGPFTEISRFVTPPLTEGPTLFRRGDEWVMFYDHFVDGYFGGSRSTDGRKWTSLTDRVRFPEGPRHGGVLEVDEGELSRETWLSFEKALG